MLHLNIPYETKVNGEYMSKVRIVIGKRNQNRKANEELAYKIKAIADKAYPGLIKDIYDRPEVNITRNYLHDHYSLNLVPMK